MQRSIEVTLDAQPDVVALTGDFQHYAGDIGAAARQLARFGEWSEKEKGGQGAFAVLGNHDTWNSATGVTQALREVRIPVLNDRAGGTERGNAKLPVAGVADMWALRSISTLPSTGYRNKRRSFCSHTYPICSWGHCKRMSPSRCRGTCMEVEIKLPFAGAMLSPSRYNRRYVEGFYRRERACYTAFEGWEATRRYG